MHLFKTELKKLRRRHIGLLYGGALLLVFAWMAWALSDMDELIVSQGYYYLLLSIPLINAVILPTILAAVESRLCDIEIKGNTFKMLCTMETRKSIFHIKLLCGVLYLLFFTLAETAMIPVLAALFHVQQPFPVLQVCLFAFSTFTVSVVLILIQQTLSLLSSNQLLPLFVGVGGTFVGLFTWFFPQLPLRYFLPWGYYCVGTAINMYYDDVTRYLEYYTIPFPVLPFAGFMLFGLLAYAAGKKLFLNKEV